RSLADDPLAAGRWVHGHRVGGVLAAELREQPGAVAGPVGGHEARQQERYAVVSELLAAAPIRVDQPEVVLRAVLVAVPPGRPLVAHVGDLLRSPERIEAVP